MIESIEKMAETLRERGYEIEEVKIESGTKNLLKTNKTRKFRLDDKKAIDDFCKRYGPLISVSFVYSKFLRKYREFNYKPDASDPKKWVLNYMQDDGRIFLNDGRIKDIIEIHI